MKNYLKIALILAFGILIFFQIKSFASKNAQLKSLLLQREIQSLEFQTRFSRTLKAPDEASLSDKLSSLYTAVIEDPASARNDKLKAKESLAHLKYMNGEKDKAYSLALETLTEQPCLYLSSAVLFAVTRDKADEYIRQSQYDQAISEYQNLLKLPLLEGYLATTEFYIACTYYHKEDYASAIASYQGLISNHPFLPNWQSYAQYKIAELYLFRRDYPKAREELNNLLTIYPYSPWSKLAKDKLKEISLK